MAFKRFIVLMDEQYYPMPGMSSAEASFDTLEEAMALAMTERSAKGDSVDYVQVFDCDARQVVWENE